LNKRALWGSLRLLSQETIQVCHALVQSPPFFLLLLRIDEELAEEARSGGCACGGVLHRANYPRKPRACPKEVGSAYESRFSFLGRRVYLGLAVVLVSARHAGQTPAAARLSGMLDIPVRTLQRWREWWQKQFPLTQLWQASCARFMPPVATDLCPASLLERFAGSAEEALMRLLVFLSPLTVKPINLREGR
jgi:hypothetical protein